MAFLVAHAGVPVVRNGGYLSLPPSGTQLSPEVLASVPVLRNGGYIAAVGEPRRVEEEIGGGRGGHGAVIPLISPRKTDERELIELALMAIAVID